MPRLIPRRTPHATTGARRFRLGDWMSAPEWISVNETAGLSGYDLEGVWDKSL